MHHTIKNYSMKFAYLCIIFCLLAYCSQSKCVSLAGACLDVTQWTMQFNINWRGVPKYEDVVYSTFNENQCGRKRFSFLYHNILSCKDSVIKRNYTCTSKTKSVWLKVFDPTDYMVNQFVSHCHKDLAKKYIDISKLHCYIDGVDPFVEERKNIGKTVTRSIVIDENNFPQYPMYFPEKDSCIWNYEVEGIWSGLVITIVTCISVVLVLFIIVFVYAQKHRKEYRNSLNRSDRVNLIDEYEAYLYLLYKHINITNVLKL